MLRRTMQALALALAAAPALHAQLGLEAQLVAAGFDSPVMVAAPEDDERLFVADSTGVILVVKDGAVLPTPFLDISAKVYVGAQLGLAGFAFHPDFATNGWFYVYYTNHHVFAVLERYRVSGSDPDVANPASATLIFGPIAWPQMFHTGGGLAFGPDGNLWLGIGDERDTPTASCAAQRGDVLLGKLVRLRDDGSIPPDNPFVSDPGVLDPIWALGLRQPYRLSFDPATGDLWIADIGEAAREELDFVPAGTPGGMNFGWRMLEGTLCTGFQPCAPLSCSGPWVPPTWEYDHESTGDCCIIGGALYRGTAVAPLDGQFVYAELCTGKLVSLTVRSGAISGSKRHEVGLPGVPGSAWVEPVAVAQLGQQLYVVDHGFGVPGEGKLFRLAPSLFEDVGFGLAGAAGVPQLHASGTLQPGSPMLVQLSSVVPASVAQLVIGVAPYYGPLKGGILVPVPKVVITGLVVNSTSEVQLLTTWPPGVPPGVQVLLQAWLPDPSAPQGFSASNGLAFTTP